MPRKKLPPSQNQDAINSAADQVVSALTASVLDRAEEKFMDFFLGGGFHSELAGQLNPILSEFTNSLGLPSSGSSSLGLIGDSDDRPMFDVEAQDV